MGGGRRALGEARRTRGREWPRATGTGLAVVALAVLGAWVHARESGSEGHVSFGSASVARPSSADAGAGRCERTIDPVGGHANRHASSKKVRSAYTGPTGTCSKDGRLRAECRSRDAPSIIEASGSDGAAQGVGKP